MFDADDTLWENNVHFERMIEEFIDFIDHAHLTRDEIRAVLDEIERANIATHGYGAAGFSRNLRQTYERLAEREIADEDLATVMAFGGRILSQEIELIDGVVETLDYLGQRHHLIMMTKGHPEEQRLKIERSGLEPLFREAIVVPEKDVIVYQRVVDQLDADPARTWMIGNSPRSDINPALAAGLNAVFVPHDQTWRLEHEELATGPGRLVVLDRFAELLDHF